MREGWRRRRTGDLVEDVETNILEVGRQVELAGAHGTESVELQLAEIDGLADDAIAVGDHLDIGGDVALNGGDANDIDVNGPVVGGEDYIKERGRELRVGLTGVQRVGHDQPLRRHDRDQGDERGDDEGSWRECRAEGAGRRGGRHRGRSRGRSGRR